MDNWCTPLGKAHRFRRTKGNLDTIGCVESHSVSATGRKPRAAVVSWPYVDSWGRESVDSVAGASREPREIRLSEWRFGSGR